MTQETVKITLSHPQGVDPQGLYHVRQVHPPRTVGGDPELREITLEGSQLVEQCLGANHFPLRFIDPPPVVPLLDTLSGSLDLHWCRLDQVAGKLAEGFILVGPDGHVLGYNRLAGGALAGRVWSAWRRRAEAEAAAEQAATTPPQIESAEAIPEPPPPAPRRRSPWRKPTTEEAQE